MSIEPERARLGPTTDFLAAGGEMGALMRSMDWSQTPIGPVDFWSPTLKMMASFTLANGFPLLLWWGPRYCQLYNDRFRPILGDKHPKAMGQPASECFPEIWHIIGPLIETPFHGGEATWMDDILLEINRYGFTEETHFTIAYSPVPDDTMPSRIGGVLATVHEISEKIVGERRVLLLRDLGARSTEAKTAEEACSIAAETLVRYPKDVPFALLYLVDGDRKRARLAGASGFDTGLAESLPEVDLAEGTSSQQPWPLAEALHDEAMQIVQDVPRKSLKVPPGPWSDPPQLVVVLPIRSNMAHQLAGLLVFGISSRLRFDDRYRDFCELVTSQVATAIANARAYEEERKRAEALAEIDRAKTAFFSNVSHEFRTPLTLMLGPLQDMLARAGESLTGGREELELIHRNGLRLLKLVNALLDFSRIEAGRLEAFYEPTDLAGFTTELASVFRSVVEKAGLRLSVDCPPLAEPVYVDRAMWEKIVLNLISNAFKFTFEGEVTVSLHKVSQSVELSISDTGTGIPEHELPRIFDRFHRVEGAQGRNYEGSGIGLALVQELGKLHGGAVRAESTYGRGSRFTVSIPLGQAHLPIEHLDGSKQSFTVGASAYAQQALHWLPDTASAPAIPDGAAPSRRSAARILLADDNADMRAYVQRLLAGSYEVEAFGDGETALATALKNPPDLVLTDIMMPRLDGLALLQALRADPRTRNVPVILLSARAGEESRLEGLEAGAYDYLIKPFSARELLAQVSSRLELARLHRDARERESFIEQIAELTPVVLSVFDLVTERDVYISRDVTTLSGYTGDELKQMQDPFSTLWHSDDIPRHRDHLARWKRMADGEIFEFQFRVRHRDGRWRWLETRSMPFCRSEAGDVRQIVAATLDVTARKQAEEALCASEERFRRYFELGLIGMAITSPEKGYIEVNDEICRILGYQRDELLRMTWAELTHPDDLAADIANFNHVMAGEIDGYSMDKRWVRKDGQAIYSTISVECVRREDRSVDYFVALLQDITARKRAEEDLAKAYDDLERRVVERTAQLTAINKELRNEVIERKRTEGLLREANQRIEMILDSISDNFFSLDKDFRFSYLNKRAQEQVKRLGKDPERLIGKVLWDEFKDVPNEAAIRRVISERVAIHDELYYPPLKEWVENHMYPRGDGGLASFQRYITDRKRAEAESLALKDALADELAAMTRLHEFSTRMLASTELQPLLEEVLNAIISLQKADFGNIQLYNMESQTLEIVAQRGFQQDFLDHSRSVHDDGAACGRAMQGRERIIIEDVQTDPKFEPHRAIAASAGFAI